MRASVGVALCAPIAVSAEEESPTQVEADDLSYFDAEESADVALTSLQQPAENMTPREVPPRPTTRRGPPISRQGNLRLASVPNMFGDVFMSGGRVTAIGPLDPGNDRVLGGFDIPGAGGSRRVKIGENNKALPSDRVYFMYNHFENALAIQELSTSPPGPALIHQAPIDRYTVGFEKMFLDDLWSCEVRLPFNGSYDATVPNLGVSGGNVGNLAVILKNLLYVDEYTSVAAGIGFDTPTGSDVHGQAIGTQLTFENDAFHLLPYVGFVHALDDRFFVLGFWQIDLAASGNEVLASNSQFSTPQSLGYLNEQNVMYFDIAFGGWAYRNHSADVLTGIAVLGEVHYTTTLQNTDDLRVTSQGTLIDISNPYNRQDVVNLTAALQFEIASTTTLRVAGVFPLGERPDQRFFDAEVQVQLNRQF